MRARIIYCFIFLALFVSVVSADQKGPVVISPGIETGVAVVGQSCPTFSWTAVEWAEAYKVVVFETNGPNVLAYEEMEAIASPVLAKEIQGRALSWTPSSDERLNNGGMYVWYVQALDSLDTGIWSEGRMFKVEVEVQLVGMEETVRKSLREKGMSEEAIEDVLEDMRLGRKEAVVYGVDTEGSENKTQDKIGIQGLEGSTNTFYGLDAGSSITTGGYNSFFGRYAGYSTTTGDSNTFLGYLAGLSNTTGIGNVFLGFYAGYSSTANYNTFIGYEAGLYNTTGEFNTFLGYEVGRSNTTASHNTFIGYEAGYYNTASDNTFIGYRAGYINSAGNNNTFLGNGAGLYNSTGYSNTFVGHNAGYVNSAGNNNTFVGLNAGYSNTTGDLNTFMGNGAGYSNTTGDTNTFMGYGAGGSNTTGYGNTILGFSAGSLNTTGNMNVFLGIRAGFSETGSNRLYIDNSNSSFPLIYGEFDNDIVAINGKFGVGTQSPAYPMHLTTSGTNAAFVADRSGGATNYINATAGYGNFGTVNNYPLRLVVNGLWKMRLDSDQSLTMANGATCTAGGVWTDASSRELKENIRSLTTEEAINALKGLNPVMYNYKSDKEEGCVGFIAEEVPDLVASKDRKGMSPMDVVAVLTKVVQEQQKTIAELQKQIGELKAGEK